MPSRPYWRALATQAFAGCVLLILGLTASRVFQFEIDFEWLFLLQGALALLLAMMSKQELWWRCIHFLFPITSYETYQLDLPSYAFLGCFVLLASVFACCCQTRVPYFPSRSEVWGRVEALLKVRRSKSLIDIGSGLGGLVIDLKRRNPDLEVSGIESGPLPWLVSFLRTAYHNSKAKFIFGDYRSLNFSSYDAVFAYLSPAAMEALYKKANNEMRNQTLLISHEFAVPDVVPSYVIDAPESRCSTYVYVISSKSH